MNKHSFFAILIGYTLCGLTASAGQPAPTNIGVGDDGPQVVQNETKQTEPGTAEKKDQSETESKAPAPLEKQIADLETEIKTLRATIEKLNETQKELEQLRGKVTILEGENTGLKTRVKTLEEDKTAQTDRIKRLEADTTTLQEFAENADNTAKRQMTAKPAFVHSAVRFYNHEGHPLRMNVNGVWHTLKPGKNDIFVPYGPVHIHRYNGAEPKLFADWKPYQDGYIMEFDVGTPAEK